MAVLCDGIEGGSPHHIKSGAGGPPAAKTAANALTLSPVKVERAF